MQIFRKSISALQKFLLFTALEHSWYGFGSAYADSGLQVDMPASLISCMAAARLPSIVVLLGAQPTLKNSSENTP